MMGRRRAFRRLANSLASEAWSTTLCALRYPLGIANNAVTTGRPSGELRHDTPVILVHGYGHNRSAWWELEAHLRRAGFTSVHTLNYVPFSDGVNGLARRLAARVEDICRLTGASRVHLVGHSLGGILIRWYVEELGGHDLVDTAVTLATPHTGTVLATLAPGRTGHDLLPWSRTMRRLAASQPADTVRWITYGGGIDVLVPPAAAQLRDAVNVVVPGVGHLGLLLSPRVAASVAEQLEAAEGVGAAVASMRRSRAARHPETVPRTPGGTVSAGAEPTS